MPSPSPGLASSDWSGRSVPVYIYILLDTCLDDVSIVIHSADTSSVIAYLIDPVLRRRPCPKQARGSTHRLPRGSTACGREPGEVFPFLLNRSLEEEILPIVDGRLLFQIVCGVGGWVRAIRPTVEHIYRV